MSDGSSDLRAVLQSPVQQCKCCRFYPDLFHTDAVSLAGNQNRRPPIVTRIVVKTNVHYQCSREPATFGLRQVTSALQHVSLRPSLEAPCPVSCEGRSSSNACAGLKDNLVMPLIWLHLAFDKFLGLLHFISNRIQRTIMLRSSKTTSYRLVLASCESRGSAEDVRKRPNKPLHRACLSDHSAEGSTICMC
jgi:hypothetical protein